MRFFTALFGIVTFAVAVLAQGGIQFTSYPPSVVVGQTYTLTWSGGDSSPVTIILREGNPGSLTTVKTITTTASGGSFQWTPDSNIPDGSSYALEILQGTDSNYSGPFSISGGSASAASSSAASALSSQNSVASSMASIISSQVSSQSVAQSSRTATTTSASNSTATSSSSSSSRSSSSSSKSTSGPSTPVSTGGAVSFGANQAVLALGAMAVILY